MYKKKKNAVKGKCIQWHQKHTLTIYYNLPSAFACLRALRFEVVCATATVMEACRLPPDVRLLRPVT